MQLEELTAGGNAQGLFEVPDRGEKIDVVAVDRQTDMVKEMAVLQCSLLFLPDHTTSKLVANESGSDQIVGNRPTDGRVFLSL